GTNLTVNGTASFVTTGTGTSGNITLLNLTNKFGRFDARGTNISVSDPPAGIVLGNVVASGDFFANGVTGPITQAAGTSVQVAGTANFITAGTGNDGNITLDSTTNNFSAAGNISASGGAVTIVNSNATMLGTITATGLSVNSTGGPITQATGTSLTIAGTANIVSTGSGNEGNITLNNATNDFNILTASGTNLTLADQNNVTLNNTSITRTVNITAANIVTVTGSYTAANTIVSNGTLVANGLMTTNLTIAVGAANIQTGGNVTGATVVNSGSLTSNGAFGSLTMNNGTTLYTSSTGTVVNGNLTFANGSIWNATGSSLSNFSKISTTGLVTIQPTANLTLTSPSGMVYGNGITLIDQSGSTLINQSTGFANLPQRTIFTNNNNVLVMNYNGAAGNYSYSSNGVDLIISVAPGKIQVLSTNITGTAGQQFSSNLNIRVISDFNNPVGIPGIPVMITLPG
ncbi:MAG: beta strand repeat-containing protein, partial [bacterium]